MATPSSSSSAAATTPAAAINSACAGCSSAGGCPGAASAAAAPPGGCAGARGGAGATAGAAGGSGNGNGNGIKRNGGGGGCGGGGGGCGGGGGREQGAADQPHASAAASIFSIARDGSLLPPPQPKGRHRTRLQQQQQEQLSSQQHNNSGSSSSYPHAASSASGGLASSAGASHTSSSALALSWRRGQRWSFSARLLVAIAALWLGAAALMLLVPETQSLLTYLHWVRWPLFKDLRDLRSFRLEAIARNIRVSTADGQSLGGWHILPSHRVAAEANRHPLGSRAREAFFDEALGREGARVVIYFHGNAASRGHWERVELVKALSSRLDAHVIAVDYRGFADSTGWPSERGLAQDAQAVWAWVRSRTHTAEEGGRREGSPPSVYLYGQSLGSAVAVRLAHSLSAGAGAEGQQCGEGETAEGGGGGNGGALTGLILDAPFPSLPAAALHHPSALPFRLLPFVPTALKATSSPVHEKYPSIDLLPHVPVPTLIIHGRRDRMIPFRLGQELYQAARLGRIRAAPHLLEDLWFSELPQGAHSDAHAHAQWTHDVSAFMAAMEGRG